MTFRTRQLRAIFGRRQSSREPRLRAKRAPLSFGSTARLHDLTLALGAILALLAVWVVVQRFRYPIDAQWTTGAVRAAVARVRDGLPLYVAPSAHYVSLADPPLYVWICAAVAHACSPFVACKIVSTVSMIVSGWGLFRLADLLGATPVWRDHVLALHVVTYALTTLLLDLEDPASLHACLVVLGLVVLLGGYSPQLAGALMGLACFADAAGLALFAAAAVGLVIANERRRALLLASGGVAVLVVLGGYLALSTDGWFTFHAVCVPLAQPWSAASSAHFLVADVPLAFALAAASLAMIATSAKRGTPWPETVLASVLAAALLVAVTCGGSASRRVVLLELACVAAVVMATRLERAAEGTRAAQTIPRLLLAGACLQILGSMFDPFELAPDRSDLADRRRLGALVQALEADGDVLVTTNGGLTRSPSLHASALDALLRAGEYAPPDLLDGLAERRYAALLLPRLFDCPFAHCDELAAAVARNYFVAGRRPERNRGATTGEDARARWLLRPRQRPLDLSLDQLRGRLRIEQGFATIKSAGLARDEEITPADDIEDLASGVGAR